MHIRFGTKFFTFLLLNFVMGLSAHAGGITSTYRKAIQEADELSAMDTRRIITIVRSGPRTLAVPKTLADGTRMALASGGKIINVRPFEGLASESVYLQIPDDFSALNKSTLSKDAHLNGKQLATKEKQYSLSSETPNAGRRYVWGPNGDLISSHLFWQNNFNFVISQTDGILQISYMRKSGNLLTKAIQVERKIDLGAARLKSYTLDSEGKISLRLEWPGGRISESGVTDLHQIAQLPASPQAAAGRVSRVTN